MERTILWKDIEIRKIDDEVEPKEIIHLTLPNREYRVYGAIPELANVEYGKLYLTWFKIPIEGIPVILTKENEVVFIRIHTTHIRVSKTKGFVVTNRPIVEKFLIEGWEVDFPGTESIHF